MKVVIVGAGPAGLALALALRQVKVEVVVLERRSEDTLFVDAGGAYELSAKSLEVLERLGVLASVRARATPLRHFELTSAAGTTLQRLDFERANLEVWSITRAELQRALRAHLEGVDLRCGVEVSAITQDETGVDVVVSGERLRADVLIGADGIHSVVRARCFEGPPSVEVGLTAWWGRTRVEALAEPVTRGHSRGVIAPGASFVSTVSTDERELLWTVCTVGEGEHPDVSALPTAVQAVVAKAHFVAKTKLREQRPLARWSTGRVALIGDAAHGMTPFLGLGANSALEDAWLVGQAIAEGAPLGPLLEARANELNPRIAEARRLGAVMHSEWTVVHAGFRLLTWLVPERLVVRQLRARHTPAENKSTAP